MRKKRSGPEMEGHGTGHPLFICQDRQCYGPMMTRVYEDVPQPPDDRREFEDLREDIPVKKKVPADGIERY
jgi:hypothetical protein